MIDLDVKTTGFVVVRNGVMDVSSTMDSKRRAMCYELVDRGVLILPCDVPGCRCVEDAFAKYATGAVIREVKIEVIQ